MNVFPALLCLTASWALAPGAAAQHATSPDVAPDGELLTQTLMGAPASVAASPGALLAGTPLAGAAPVFEFLSTGVAPEGDTPSGVQFTPDGARLVVAHRASRNLIVLDAATRAFVGSVALSGSPNGVACSSDGVHAVTANLWEDTASIVDLSTLSEIAVVAVGDQPGLARITPDGLTAVVGNTVGQSLSVIDIATAIEVHRIAGAGFNASSSIAFESGAVTTTPTPFELASNTLAVHPDFANDRISFFDLAAGTVTSIPSVADPFDVAITPGGQTAVVTHIFGNRTISVVDVATRTVTKTISTGIDLSGRIAIQPNGARAAATVSNAVVIVDLATDVVSAPLATASVDDLLPTADGNYVLCAGFNGSLISWTTQTIVKNLNGLVSTPLGAVSPVGPRAVLVANLFGEDLLVANTNGSSGFLEGRVPSGAPPEADATRKVAISPDGTRAVTTNILSDTASILDLATGTVLAIVDVGDRPAEVEITPDGQKAVVANLDSTFVSIIDLSTFAVTNVPISTRGSAVEIAPNGAFAYVAVVSSGDGVWRIDLNTPSVSGPKLLTGNMGGLLYLFQQNSGITLSHDGATLAVCGSFDDRLTLIDTASWSVVANVTVGDMPVRALFTDDDSRIYVTNRDSGDVSVVTNSGAASTLTATWTAGVWPFEMALTPDGAKLYVADFQDDAVRAIDTATGGTTQIIGLPASPQGLHLAAGTGRLFAASGTWSVTLGPGPAISIASIGAFTVIDTATDGIVDQLGGGLPPAMLAFDASDSFGLAPSPFGDGLSRYDIETGPIFYCTAKTSSAGCVAALTTTNPLAAPVSGAADYEVQAISMQGVKPGIYFFGLAGPAAIPFLGGTLCMTPPIGRGPLSFSGGSSPTACDGGFSLVVNDGVSLFDPGPGGQVWLQAWYRDPANGSGSLGTALSSAVELTFE